MDIENLVVGTPSSSTSTPQEIPVLPSGIKGAFVAEGSANVVFCLENGLAEQEDSWYKGKVCNT